MSHNEKNVQVMSNYSNTRDLASLIDFYRLKSETFDKERMDWIGKIENLRFSLKDKHRVEWELKTRYNEILNLQSNKSELIRAINAERRKICQLNAEVDFYKKRSQQDRKRMIQLLQLSEPVEQQISLNPGQAPTMLEKFSRPAADGNMSRPSISTHVDSNFSSKKSTNSVINNTTRGRSVSSARLHKTSSTPKIEKRIRPSQEKQHILRSIVFPNNEKSLLGDEIEFLKRQIIEIREFYEDMLSKQLDLSKIYEEELKLQIENFKQRINEISSEKERSLELVVQLTKETMIQKFDFSRNETKLFEEIELLKLQNQALISSIKEYSNQKNSDKAVYINEMESKVSEISKLMRIRVKSSEENLRIIKEQYKQVQSIYSDKFKDCETMINRLLDENNSLRSDLKAAGLTQSSIKIKIDAGKIKNNMNLKPNREKLSKQAASTGIKPQIIGGQSQTNLKHLNKRPSEDLSTDQKSKKLLKASKTTNVSKEKIVC